MDEFLEGLASRLRMSGMIADSIMMGIVNSRMEEAHKKVCSKEGGVEQLNEKSRFCELAVMQLDWCIRFVHEEMDNHMAGTSFEREDLAADLMETRERIQGRLEETELAIKEKDKELDQRAENEHKLRQALELREDELRSLTSAFEFERVRSERVWESVQQNQFERVDDGSEDFTELRNSVEQQFRRLKQKLEDGEANMIKGIKQMSWSPDTKKLIPELELEARNCNVTEVNEGIGTTPTEGISEDNKNAVCENKQGNETEVLMSFPKPELKVAFEQMGRDIGVLKDMLEMAFVMMDTSVRLHKVRLMEQSWRWILEQEIVGIVTKSLLKSIREKYETKLCTGCTKFAEDWFCLVDKMKDFCHDFEFIVDGNVTQTEIFVGGQEGPSSLKLDSGIKGLPLKSSYPISSQGEGIGVDPLERRGQSDSSVMYEELCQPKDSTREDRLGHASHYVAKMVRNHESIIRKKTEEVNPFKCDFNREKRSIVLKKDKNLDAVRKNISKLILKSEHIIEDSESLAARVTLLKHDAEKLDRENMSAVPFEGFTDSEINEIESSIREQIYLAFLAETVKSIKSSVQTKVYPGGNVAFLRNSEESFTINRDRHFQKLDEKIYTQGDSLVQRNSSSAKTKAEKNFHKKILSSVKFNCHSKNSFCEEGYALNTLLDIGAEEEQHSLCLHNGEVEMELENHRIESFIREQVYEKVFAETIKSIRSAVETNTEIDKNVTLHKESEKESMLIDDEGVSVEVENTSSQVCSELKDLPKDLQITDVNCEEKIGQSTSVEGGLQEKMHSSVSHNEEKELHINEIVGKLVTEYMKKVAGFEHIVQEKMSCNITRLGEVIYQLKPLIADVTSLRNRELLYRKGFLRRCYDLQTAEAEVDLLGDEVDLLLSLLQRTYLVLDHYSPILQHQTGISNVLDLLKHELVKEPLAP